MSQATPRPCPPKTVDVYCNKCGWRGCVKPEDPEEFYPHPDCNYSAIPVEALAAWNEREEA